MEIEDEILIIERVLNASLESILEKLQQFVNAVHTQGNKWQYIVVSRYEALAQTTFYINTSIH